MKIWWMCLQRRHRIIFISLIMFALLITKGEKVRLPLSDWAWLQRNQEKLAVRRLNLPLWSRQKAISAGDWRELALMHVGFKLLWNSSTLMQHWRLNRGMGKLAGSQGQKGITTQFWRAFPPACRTTISVLSLLCSGSSRDHKTQPPPWPLINAPIDAFALRENIFKDEIQHCRAFIIMPWQTDSHYLFLSLFHSLSVSLSFSVNGHIHIYLNPILKRHDANTWFGFP